MARGGGGGDDGGGEGGPRQLGNKPHLPPSGSLFSEFSAPLLHKIYKASTAPVMRSCWLALCDRMLNEKLRATCELCYHSICSGPQTGHYPAIIFPDLQSPVEEVIAEASPPLSGTEGNQLENLHLHDPAEQLIRSGYLFST